ncbi:Amino acid transporter, transmembrane domain containing protein [Trema orientale]|uniref:Amino acid transporter, transmembrane domain containing protein n=1 Tax=Trema orientale TaxID=63057 RepID=A0A2P5EMR9_TREOI|nr:Amino acid transporter, transmembrane domain containing protein [Trema orientale]
MEFHERSNENFSIENVEANDKITFDDDGRVKRTGTLITASAHIITAVIGSGVLSLAWAIAQLGWIAGILALIIFSIVTLFTSSLLTNFYRFPDPTIGTRNYTYMHAVEKYLGGKKYKLCGIAQYGNLIGTSIGYTITTALGVGAIKRANCFHKHGHEAECHASNELSMIMFGVLQILLSQIPNFHKLSGLSVIAAAMSFTYAFIGVGLSVSRIAGGVHPKTSLTGVAVGVDVTGEQKVWRCFQALGNIAFAYAYSLVLIDIQDTLKSSPPENQVMKKATAVGVFVTTMFYMLSGILGYIAFGNNAPGNFLTGFYEPFWLVDLANVCIVFHLVGAYQVFSQAVYTMVEEQSRKRWPETDFIVKEYPIGIPFLGTFNLNLFRAVWRTFYVIVTTTLAIIFPFFNDILGLLGACGFWPLTVYFPIEMHIAQTQIQRYSRRWLGLKLLSSACLIVSLLAAAGSIRGIVTELKTYRPFMSVSDS